MWFKNLNIYRFTQPFTHALDTLDDPLRAFIFKPCGGHEEARIGWISPVNEQYETLFHATNGYVMLCMKRQEKLLPKAVINELMQEKAIEFEEQYGRKLAGKEKTQLKDELIFDLLPKAFTYSKKIYGYIDSMNGWLVIDTPSTSKAEEFLSLLRKSLGTLPVIPIKPTVNPVETMTRWVSTQQPPADFSIAHECELRTGGEEASIIRCKNQDLSLPEIQGHLDSGKEVIKLAVNWADRLAFTIDKDLSLKRLKMLELIEDKLKDNDTGDANAEFDADFEIMTSEISSCLTRLSDVFAVEVK
jgi:recombination associated protein RdgC